MKKWNPEQQIDGLSATEQAQLLYSVATILWPIDDPEQEWTSETVDLVAAALRNFGVAPEVK